MTNDALARADVLAPRNTLLHAAIRLRAAIEQDVDSRDERRAAIQEMDRAIVELHDASWRDVEDAVVHLKATLPDPAALEASASRIADLLERESDACGVAPHYLGVLAYMTLDDRGR